MIERLNFPDDARIRIISDIHLGHKKSFISGPRDLIPLLNDCDVLVCLGDTAETRTGKYQSDGLRKREELKALCQSMGRELVIIGGNHDPDAPARAAFLDEGNIFMMHGDALFKTGAPWGREYLQNKKLIKNIIRQYPEAGKTLEDRLNMCREIAGAVPAVLSRQTRYGRLVNFLLHASWPPSRPVRIMAAWAFYKYQVRRFVRKYTPDSHIIITGHLHRRSVFMADGRLYINTGAFFSHSKPWIIDLHKDAVTISLVNPDFSAGAPAGSYPRSQSTFR